MSELQISRVFCVRIIGLLLLSSLSMLALANPPHSGARPQMNIEWNNTLPEQRRALDSFYQSLPPTGAGFSQPDERIQQLQQLRGMSSEQRQQMFRNFVQESESQRYR